MSNMRKSRRRLRKTPPAYSQIRSIDDPDVLDYSDLAFSARAMDEGEPFTIPYRRDDGDPTELNF